jgi:hypothetical protein
MANYAARIKPINASSTVEDFIFDFAVRRGGITRLAPKTIRRTYSALYVDVPLALADHSPKEWKANAPIDIPIEFEIVGEQQNGVDTELRKLRKFMRKDRRTGEPPDLLLIIGTKQWTVRLNRMEVQPVLWNENTEEQRVKVQLNFHTTEQED